MKKSFRCVAMLLALLLLMSACGNEKETEPSELSEKKFTLKSGDTHIISELEEKYPHFFGLSTEGGLTVYVWQTSINNERCYVVSTDMAAVTDESFAFTVEESASYFEMLLILDTYELPREAITIQPVVNPLSTYTYTFDEEYRKKTIDMFWFNATVQKATQLGPTYDSAVFDIDNDGIMEECVLGNGGTSGIFSFAISVWEPGKEKIDHYFFFTAPYGDLSFAETDTGVKLRHLAGWENDYAIRYRDGQLILVAEKMAERYKEAHGSYSIPSAYSEEDAQYGISGLAHARFVKRYKQTPEDQIQNVLDKGESCILKTYFAFYDGTWGYTEDKGTTWDCFAYQYQLELTGVEPATGKDITLIVLSNRQDITFQEAWPVSGIGGESDHSIDPEDAIVVAFRQT